MNIDVISIPTPMLRLHEAGAIKEFLSQWRDYKRAVEDRNNQLGPRQQIRRSSLASCIAESVLDLITNYEMNLEDDEEVDERQLETYLTSQLPERLVLTNLDHLRGLLLAEIEDPGPRTDAVSRIQVIWTTVVETTQTYALRDLWISPKALKLLRRVLEEVIKDEELSTRWNLLHNSVGAVGEQIRSSFKGIYQGLKKCAERHMSEQEIRNRMKLSKSSRKRKAEEKDKAKIKDKEEAKRRKYGKNYKTPEERRVYKQGLAAKAKTKQVEQSKSGITCWKCKEKGHTSYNCKDFSTKDEAREWVRSYRASQANTHQVSAVGKSGQTVQVEIGPGKYVTTALLDSGASITCIDEQVCKQSGLIMQPSANEQITLAVKGRSVYVAGQCYGMLRINNVTIRNVRMLVLSGSVECILIGAEVLEVLGIGPKEALEQRYERHPAVFDFILNSQEPSSNSGSGVHPTGRCLIAYTHGVNQDQGDVSEIQREMNALVERSAQSGGLTPEQKSVLSNLVFEFEDIWRINLEEEKNEPAKVQPLRLIPKHDCQPRRARPRRYNIMERRFLEKMTTLLLKNGAIYRNYRSRWSSPSYVIKKPGRTGTNVDDYRWTVDLRYVNSQCHKIAGVMPIVSVVLDHLQGMKYYCSLDAHKGYWQFPLHKDSQEMCSFLTHQGVFSPTRILQGHQDSVAAFQMGMQEIVGDLLYKFILVWVDDLLGYSQTIDEMMSNLRLLFTRVRQFNVKLSPKKSTLITKEIQWCGRLINAKGIRFDPSMIQGLRDMEVPQTASQLQQLLCGANWLRVSLPGYAAVTGKLQDKLKTISSTKGTVKKSVLKTVSLTWSDEELKSLQKLKDLLSQSVQLSHFRQDSEWSTCLFTDASDRYWGVVLTQCPKVNLAEPIKQQKHEPLAFLSGSFKGSQLRWSVIVKEAYPIIHSLDRLRHYLSARKFIIFTDHRNLKYVFSSYMNTVSKTVSDKLARWHVKLQSFDYTIEHIQGNVNFWADLLSRWRSPPTLLAPVGITRKKPPNNASDGVDASLTRNREIDVGDLQEKPDSISEKDNFERIMDELSIVGTSNSERHFSEICEQISELALDESGRRIVTDDLLKAKLIVLAHSGMSGHRGVDHTCRRLLKFFYWNGIEDNVKLFVSRCIHCLSAKDFKVRSLLSSQLHASKVNEIIHYDFLMIKKEQYLLVIKDDLSHFVELIYCTSANHFVVVDALLQWNARYGMPRLHISDQGSHFKNHVCKELERLMGITHRFTPTYSPQSNGTVEIVNRHILKILRSLKSEYQISDWTTLIPLIQACLNQNGSPSLGDISPMEVFLGRKPDNPISILFDSVADVVIQPKNADEIKSMTEALQQDLVSIHREIETKKSMDRQARLQRRNRTRAKHVFHVGEYVMLHITNPVDKSSARYDGPWLIVATVSEHVFVLRHILSAVEKTVHVDRMLYFTGEDTNAVQKMKEHVLFHKGASYEVERLLDIQERDGVECVLVQWLGFDESEATWEPLKQIREDLPELVEQFLEDRKVATAL